MPFGEEAKTSAEVWYHPVCKYVRLHPEDGSTSVAIDTSSQEKSFRIPNNIALNLAKSILSFDILFAAGGTTNKYNHCLVDMVPFERVKLELESGQILADCNNVHVLSKCYRPMVTSQEEYMSREPVRTAATVATSFGYCSGLQPSGGLKTQAIAADGIPHAQYITGAGSASGTSITIDVGQLKDSVCTQMLVESAGGTAGNKAVGWRWRIKLEDLLPSSILSNDTMLHFAQSLFLRLQWLPRNKLGALAPSVTDPATSAADFASNVTVSNLVLLVNKDINPITRDRVMNAVNSGNGITVQVPWIVSSHRTTGSEATYSFQHHITPGWAKRLMRVVTAFANNTTSGRLTADLDSVNNKKVLTYQQKMDTTPIENEFVSCDESETHGCNYWEWVKEMLKGSAITDRRMHQIKFAIVGNFTSCMQSKDWREHDHTQESGQEIDREMDYTLDVTKQGAKLQVYQFAIYLRKLNINKTMTSWV